MGGGTSMKPVTVRLCGYAGLLGALAMFAGDMLFYGQWASGAEALNGTWARVQQSDPAHLVLGGLTSIIGGLGYAIGAAHVYERIISKRAWFKIGLASCFLAIAIIATATHAVWGGFALAINSGTANALQIGSYLTLYFQIGGIIGAIASILLAIAVATRQTDWPFWFILANPGAIYLLLSTAAYLPAPLGAPLVGGAFNIAFVVFYGLSLSLPHRATLTELKSSTAI